MRTINLSEEEFERLVHCLGYATGAAYEKGETVLARTFIRLANAVNRDNPAWIPYQGLPKSQPGG